MFAILVAPSAGGTIPVDATPRSTWHHDKKGLTVALAPRPRPADPVRTDHPDHRRRPRNRRAAVLAAAFDAFAHHGYHATSMADIARAVHITPAALYRHFRNKQHLLGQCVLAGLDEALIRLDAAARSPHADDAVITALVDIALTRRGLPRLWQLESRHLGRRDRAAVLLRATRITGHLRRAIRARRPELSGAQVECLSWCALSVAVSPAYHRVELPSPVAARVLRAALWAVVATDLPEPSGDAARTPHSGGAEQVGPRRERILDEATRLFTRHGFPEVSIHDIGAAAGVTGPAVYHYFDSKAELLDIIVRSHDESIVRLVDGSTGGDRPPEVALDALTREFVRFGAEDPDLLAITVSESRHLPGAAERRYRTIRQHAIARWARTLIAARPELAPPVARMLVRALTTVVIEAVRNPRLTRRGDLVEFLVAVGLSIQRTPATRHRVTAPVT